MKGTQVNGFSSGGWIGVAVGVAIIVCVHNVQAQQADVQREAKEAIRVQLRADTAWASFREAPDTETFNRNFVQCARSPGKLPKCVTVGGNRPVFVILDIQLSPQPDRGKGWVMLFSPERDSLGFALFAREWAVSRNGNQWSAARTGAVRTGLIGN